MRSDQSFSMNFHGIVKVIISNLYNSDEFTWRTIKFVSENRTESSIAVHGNAEFVLPEDFKDTEDEPSS